MGEADTVPIKTKEGLSLESTSKLVSCKKKETKRMNAKKVFDFSS